MGIAAHPASAQKAHDRGNKATVNPVYNSGAPRADLPSNSPSAKAETHEKPARHNTSRARLIACAPIRILLFCSRRSQSSLLPLARQPLTTSTDSLSDPE